MPQIFVILDKKAQVMTKEQREDLMRRLIKIVEKVYEIKGENDVAYTFVNAEETWNEKNVQVEYRYTIGTAEYTSHKGKIFNPSRKKQVRWTALSRQ